MSKNKLIYFADFETSYINEFQKQQDVNNRERYVYSIGIKKLGDTNNSSKLFYGEHALKEFIDYVIDIKKHNTKDEVIVYFHNLKYDWSYIVYYLNKNNYYLDKKLNGFSFNELRDDISIYSGEICFSYKHKGFKKVKEKGNNGGKLLKDENGKTINQLDENGNPIPVFANYIVKFLDTYKLFPISVKEMGETINLPKLGDEYDYDLVRDYSYIPSDNDIKYLMRDIDIVENFYSEVEEFAKTKNTIASNTMNYFKENFFDKTPMSITRGGKTKSFQKFEHLFPNKFSNIYKTSILGSINGRPNYGDKYTFDDINNEIVFESYNGGVTQVNKMYEGVYIINKDYKDKNNLINRLEKQGKPYKVINEKEKVLDVNSLYPYTMNTCKIPFGEPIIVEYPSEKELNELNDEEHFILLKIENLNGFVKDDKLPTIPVTRCQKMNSNALYFRILKHEEICVNLDEFNLHKKHYIFENDGFLGYTIVKALIFPCVKNQVFNEYIKFFGDMKVEAKRNGNKVREKIAKLFLNTLYGKFGQRIGDNKVKYYDFNLNKWVADTKVNNNKTFVYPSVASAITSYARIYMFSIIDKIPFENFLYMDTDSIHFIESDEFNLENFSHYIDKAILGKFDVENSLDVSVYLAPKKYAMINDFSDINKEKDKGKLIIKCAGLPDEAKKKITTIDEFHYGYKTSCKLQSKYIKGGIDLINTQFIVNEPNKKVRVYDCVGI